MKDFSNNRRELLDALDTIEVEEVEGDIEDGLRMARALGRAHTVAEVLLLSDGNIPLNSAMELPFMLTFERIEPKGDNIGITSLRAIRSGSTEWSLFVGIDCSENYRGTATLEAFAGDTQLLSETVAPGIDDPERVVFNVPGDVASRVQLRLSAGVNDSLLSDNVAYLDLPALRAVAVYAAEQLPACRRVFGSMPDLILSPDSTGAENAGSLYDVALDDHFSEDRETSVIFTAGEIPAALTSVVERAETADSVVDWQRSDPIMQHVGLGSVELSASVRYMSSNGVEACEEKDFQVIVHGRHGPILVKREMPTFVYYALLVDFDKTTLPYRIAFPVMLSNLVRLSLKLGGQADVRAVKTGIIDGFIASPSESCTVKLPDGASRKLVADKEGRLPGIIADKAGLYRIGGSVGSEIGASLLSAHETRLGSVEELNFAEVTVKPSDASPAAVRVLWPVIVLIALMVLLLEWWFFNRIRLVVGCNEEGKDVN